MTLIRGRYEPLEVVGRGGQGQVFRALDHQHGRHVALKVRRVRSAPERESLLQEARILLDLEPHRGLPLIRDDFFEDGEYYLVMEWIGGTDLRQLLADRGPLGVEEAVTYLAQVADALDHLHAHDPPVVHKDVKPANIVLTPAGRPVLVDFGISARHGGASAPAYGTSGFLAPELAGGAQPSPAADIFGLAATAFALLTGVPPLSGGRRLWTDFARGQAGRVDVAVRRGLAVDPSRRPATASELVSSMRAEPAARTNLPLQLSAFVGRERQLAELREVLGEKRLVTLTGPGGIGKTRLAVEVAGDLVAELADGVWLVELAALKDAGQLAAAVATALGVREEAGVALEDSLLDHLLTRHALLVVDNCEHVVEGCAHLVNALLQRAARLRVLATSREPLGIPGEMVWRVPSLTFPDAGTESLGSVTQFESVRLFCDRARLVRQAFVLEDGNASTVAGICRGVDGIPLAIELAAAHMGSLALDEIASRLDRRLELLTKGARTVMPRLQTLRATIDWSFELLASRERVLVRRLAVFAGGFTLDAIEPVCAGNDFDGESVIGSLSGLVDRSLVESDAGVAGSRYRFLETIREYALERLRESGEEDELRARHYDWFLGLASEREPSLERPGQVKLDVLETEHDNLRAAFAWAESRGDGHRTAKLATALTSFWDARGHLTEGRDRLRFVLGAGDVAPPLRAKVLAAAAGLAHAQADYAQARALYKECLAGCRELSDRRGVASSLAGLARAAGAQGNYPEARSLFEESMAIHRELGDTSEIAFALVSLGRMAAVEGGFEQARDLYDQSMRLFRRIGDQRGLAGALHTLAMATEAVEDYEQARAIYGESLAIRRSLKDRQGVAVSLAGLGGLEVTLGHLAEAERLLNESLTIARELHDRRGTAVTLHGLGRLAHAAGDCERAVSLLREALVETTQFRDEQSVVVCLESLAGVLVSRGDPLRAARLLAAACDRREALRSPLAPAARRENDRHVAMVRAALAEEFDAAWAAGRTMSLEDAARVSLGG